MKFIISESSEVQIQFSDINFLPSDIIKRIILDYNEFNSINNIEKLNLLSSKYITLLDKTSSYWKLLGSLYFYLNTKSRRRWTDQKLHRKVEDIVNKYDLSIPLCTCFETDKYTYLMDCLLFEQEGKFEFIPMWENYLDKVKESDKHFYTFLDVYFHIIYLINKT